MSTGRGALIVFEGCDRAGKSTQVKMLIEALNKRNISAISRAFPDRNTSIGKIINNFLSKQEEVSFEAAHLLFSANRWECRDKIVDSLNRGTTVIVDRYAASGAAYTSATTGKCLTWCKAPDKGLPRPDVVIYLKVSEESQRLRSDWGAERFENTTIQQYVASNYEKLMDSTWNTVNANEDKSVIHVQILEKVLDIINYVKDLPVEKLYEPTAQ